MLVPFTLEDGAVAPRKAHRDDGAFDLFAREFVVVPVGGRRLISTGLRLAIPEGYAGLIMPRSGLALKAGITVLNSPGLIDAGYRGDVGVILANLGGEEFRVNPGDRVAQLMIIQFPKVALAVRSTLSDSERGTAGYGSTGVSNPCAELMGPKGSDLSPLRG